MYARMKDWATLWVMRGKIEVFIVMLSGLCHVGCARMAGQKYIIKVFILGVGEEKARGFARLCSLCVSRVLFGSALSFFLRPTTLRRSVVTCRWIGLVITVVYFEASLIQRQVTHVDLLYAPRRWIQATFLLQHATRGTISILLVKVN